MEIVQINESILKECIEIWNEVVREGRAFPQLEELNLETGREFFSSQSFSGAAVDENNTPLGVYILHPNNVGRCGHICNASYAVKSGLRGKHIGEALVKHCLEKGRELGFKILQFNAVVESNVGALKLYKRLGFTALGVIPNGFKNIDGQYENIIVHYKEL